MSDSELSTALMKVAGPIIAELRRRGYEVKVADLAIHASPANEPAGSIAPTIMTIVNDGSEPAAD